MSWRAVSPGRVDVPDAATFADQLNAYDRFDRGREVIVARAPGRLDVMGGIADYSGSLVLQLPLAHAAWVAMQETDAPVLDVTSLPATPGAPHRELTVPWSLLERDGQPIDYPAARALFAEPERHWAAYCAGVYAVLAREHGVRRRRGVRLLVASEVPEGAGVASSAALEVATMQAACALEDLVLDPRTLALACQATENHIAGAACGVMDQMTAHCGEAGRLLALLCQPAELRDPVDLPSDLTLWGLDSGLRHTVAGSDYTDVRIGAFMGYRILAEHVGLGVEATEQGIMQIDDPRWRGYLANVEPFEFEAHLARALPEHLTGRAFVERYGGTTDPATTVDPDRTYAVRVPTTHPVREHQRVKAFADLLGSGDEAVALGELMYQSHQSMSACGLGSEGTDLLVDLVRDAGPDAGLFGAKITGGGGGGVVAVLGRRDAEPAVAEVAATYAERTGRPSRVFEGSSPGAAHFGRASFAWQP